MIKFTLIALLSACFICLSAAFSFSLELSLSPGHYAQAIETYYKDPKPDLILPMLNGLNRAGLFANGEKRLFLAAFLATLSHKGQIKLPELLPHIKEMGHDAKLMYAWSLHLCQNKDNEAMIATLLGPEDTLIFNQIRNSPSNLLDWDLAWESSVLGMYWGAFMASGDQIWLKRIIDSALDFANGRNPKGRQAAATLYDYAPNHEVIVKALQQRQSKANPGEKELLQTILDHAAA